MRFLVIAVLVLTSGVFHSTGLTQEKPTVAFEVASVRVNKNSPPNFSVDYSPNGVTYRAATRHTLIVDAYSLLPYQITGPDWIMTERYDISARAPGRTTFPELMLMLQELLRDRFMLTFHHEMKNMSVYALTVRNSSSNLHPHALNAIPSVT